jgi:aminoglycoside phosphotransferase (APT) family kinase protein
MNADRGTARLQSPSLGPGFTPEMAWQTLCEACKAAGLDSHDAQLLRLGTNANWRLAAQPILVRISPGRLTDVRKELAVARWLAASGFPAARVAEDIVQPLVLGGRIATFWELIEPSRRPARLADFAFLLGELHRLPDPDFPLPQFDPLDHTDRRLESAGNGEDARFLRDRSARLREHYARLEFVLPQGVIHGDAHEANALRGHDGTVRMLDFEAFARGPREWDLGVLAMRYRPFGWIHEDEYRACVMAYGGFDITGWPGFPVLTHIRELSMTSWLLLKAGDSPEHEAELRRRMADLHDDAAPRHWRPL